MLKTGKLKKGDTVMYKGKHAVVEKGVGGYDYVIRMRDGGRRFCVTGVNLTHYEEVLPELSRLPDNRVEPEVLEPDQELEVLEEEVVEPEAEPEPEQEGTGKPMLSRKKFDAMTKKELYNLAQLYEISGRSAMDIDGLRSALAQVIDLQ